MPFFEKHRLFRWTIPCLALVCLDPAARAIDPHRIISHYSREQWGNERGYSGGSVSAIAQTKDGYLWIGTEDRKSTRLNSSHANIYTLSLHDALPICRFLRSIGSSDGQFRASL